MRQAGFWVLLSAAWLSCSAALGQDTAAQEAARRAMVLAQSPLDAAKVLFGREASPTAGAARAIGSYERGCLSGAVAMPADGPNWQVMRPSRNRAWGHPVLIALLERLARKLPAEAGWAGLLVGDIAQPRGGPMVTGHGSHQIGLDADLWLTPMPERRLSASERDEVSAIDVVTAASRRWRGFLSIRRSRRRYAARPDRTGPGWRKSGRGGATIIIFTSDYPVRAAIRVVGIRRHRRPVMAAAKSSSGGLPRRHCIRRRRRRASRCGWRICRRLARRW
jgi:hypothetical protein